MHKHLVFHFFILFLATLHGQNSIKELPLYMSQFGVDNGLSSGGINAITESHDGYLWIGTPEGLNRFDGYRFKTYRNEPGNSKSLLNSYIENIFIDSRGLIWVITRSGGLHIYNEKEDNFLRISTKKLQSKLFEDTNGDVWVQISPFEYNIIEVNENTNLENSKKLTLDNFSTKRQEVLYPDLPKKIEKSKMVFSKKNGLWIYKNDSIFNYELNKNKQSSQLLFKTNIEELTNVKLILNPNTNEIIISSDSKILIFDSTTKKQTASILVPTEIRYSKSKELIDYKNRLWMIINNSYYRLSLETKEWNKIYLQGEGARKNLLQHTRSIYQDTKNNIWFGTRGYGLFKHSSINEAFHYFGTDRIGPSLHTMVEYNDSSLILSSSRANFPIQILDYKNNIIRDLYLPKDTYLDIFKVGFADFFKDSKQRYWLPFKKAARGDFKLLVLNDKLEIINELESPTYKQKETLINHVFETENGQIWGIGSLRKRNEIDAFPHVYLSKWSEKDKQFYFESVFENHPEELLFNRCTVAIETPDKSLWFGFENGGLLKYNTNNKTWKHLLKKNSANDKNYFNILSHYTPLEDAHSKFMLGTRSGLLIYNYQKDTYQIFNTGNGLKDNVIYGILSDNDENLWLSTNNGLCRYNTKTKFITNFSLADGLQSSEFNRSAYLKNKDGTLFFGGVGGLTWFNPDELKTLPDESQIKITGLKLNNTIADSLLIKASEIKLPYDQSLITFEFSKLNKNPINRNQYVYKLEKNSNSEEWIDLRGQSSITLTELSPANYKIYISAYDSIGKIDTEQATLTFSIAEPWWCNDWLKFLAFLIIVGIFYYVYCIKLKSKKKLEHVKNSISRDLHDEIGSTLSSIAMYGVIAEKEIFSNPEKASGLIQKINSYAVSSIESMNDIVWSIKPGNNTIIQLIKRIRFYLSEIEETGNWQTSIEYDNRILNLSFNSTFIRNIFLIIKESISNALKHSEGNTIHVRFLYDTLKETITIEIEDNGFGIKNKDVQYQKSNGLKNMHERADELKGSLEIKAKEDKGSIVRLIFNKNV